MNTAQVKTQVKESATAAYRDFIKPTFLFLFWGLLVLYVAYRLFFWLAPVRKQIEWNYDVSPSHIEVAAKPHDCEFLSAPVGSKNCHYEQSVVLLNAQGQMIGGDQVTEHGQHVKTEPKEKVTDAVVVWVKEAE